MRSSKRFLGKLFREGDNDGVTLKEIKDLINRDEDYKREIKTGKPLKANIERILETDCQDQKKLNNINRRNVFMNWKFKNNGISQSDFIEDSQ